MTIQAVVFDIGNVLLEWNPERFYDARIGEARRRALFAEVDLIGMNERIDLGAPFEATIMATAEAHPTWQAEIELWHDDWLAMASPLIDHSVRLLRALRSKGIPVHALSNFGVGSFDLAQRTYDVLTEFDVTIISGDLKAQKPDAPIYEAMEAATGLDRGALLFTDDRLDNIQAADARGWRTHLFDGPEGWADRLVTEGLLTAQEAV
ncbi:MAG: HAD-IA family hydrolase [Pseudomonadota bacterium]